VNRKLTHLNALRAFEASSRHRSFAAAAVELNVTPAAVGQLVRTLEDWLGVALFHRTSGGRERLVPTEVAERALPELRAGFDRVGVALERLQHGASNGVLTVSVSPSFAAKWLLPRLEHFQAAWPDIDIRLDARRKPADFVAHRIDVAVRYGTGHWAGLKAEKLMDEAVFPVCSPRLLDAGRLRVPADLAGQSLIHDLSMEEDPGFPTWARWFGEAGGVDHLNPGRALKINNPAAVLQAAIDGQGVALARGVMAHDDLMSGRLVRLFPEVRMRSALSYFIVYRPEEAVRPCLAVFRQWLFDQAGCAHREDDVVFVEPRAGGIE